MSPFIHKVKTASGAAAVQIVEKRRGVRRIVEHVGSAHDEADLAVLDVTTLHGGGRRCRDALTPLRTVDIRVGQLSITAAPIISPEARLILDLLPPINALGH